ncbi:uncharacterized protein LOC108904370 [Anoplophora glabripennis]|uniref:uncharacterized protein LOC108904370 n=1 Tax=Anoplophora glabripennis TaxID=217634 RepID=UPI000874F587|nr:uncharacterized protein LOC108904370 [Anoplophora glabripennis]
MSQVQLLNPLDENFFYNSMLAKALVQLIPPNERKVMRAWFDKLLELGKTNKDKELRNEYMWFILLMLQCQKVREPFISMPPSDLEPLRDLVPSKVYEEILVANDDNMAWLENLEAGTGQKRVTFKNSPPSTFFDNQPIPHEGIICYLSAFSDREF